MTIVPFRHRGPTDRLRMAMAAPVFRSCRAPLVLLSPEQSAILVLLDRIEALERQVDAMEAGHG